MPTTIKEYRAHIAAKRGVDVSAGMQPKDINAKAKEHQRKAISFALERGCAALFLDTGLGKSLSELEWARQVCEETRKPVLLLTPLAVAGQMVREGRKFGIDARQIRTQDEVGSGIMVANYERLPKLDPSSFGGVVLDESSILKSFAGRTRNMLMDAFDGVKFKLAATATPSPNDHMELGNHAEFLGVMRQQEMLSQWFINDTSTASQEWRLKGHAVDDFWAWVASWSRCATLPSDLGGDDTGYILPEIDRRIHMVAADRQQDVDQGMLFRIPEMSATSFHKEKRLTIQERCEMAFTLAMEEIRCKLAALMEDDACRGSQSTPKTEGKNTNQTRMSALADDHSLGVQKRTKSTCASITRPTQKSSKEPKRIKTGTTQDVGSDTQQTLSTQKKPEQVRAADRQRKSEMSASNRHTELTNMTMIECFAIRDFVAKFAGKNTGKKEGSDFTSIIATVQEKYGASCVQRVIPLLEKCETIATGSGQQSDILKAIVNDPVLVFCETNDEQALLYDLFMPGAFSVEGKHSADQKESDILAWMSGEKPWMISKGKILGFGMNFQFCAHVIFASIDFSYEKFYQSIRRVWRFGQDRVVRCDIVISDTEDVIWQAINVKGKKHDEMKRRMSQAMQKAQNGGSVRAVYDRPLDLAFPEWIKTKGNAHEAT